MVRDIDSDQDYYGTLYRSFSSPSDSVIGIRRLQLESIVGVLDDLKGDIVNVNDDEELDRIHATIDRVIKDLREEMDQENDDDDGDDDLSSLGPFDTLSVGETADAETMNASSNLNWTVQKPSDEEPD